MWRRAQYKTGRADFPRRRKGRLRGGWRRRYAMRRISMMGGTSMNRVLLFAAVIAAFLPNSLFSHEDDAAAGSGQSHFGKGSFPPSCAPAVQPHFHRAVALPHSFFFPHDIKAFQAVIKADPQCAMAYWGLAISQRPNPLVPPWPEENLKRALEAIQQGKAVAKSERERDWLNALEAVYRDYDRVPTSARSQRYEQAMAQLARKYPDDT